MIKQSFFNKAIAIANLWEHYSPMRRTISKVSIALVLFAIVGQTVASPLLACDDMSSMEAMSDSQSMSLGSPIDSSTQDVASAKDHNHAKDLSGTSQNIHDNCELCVGCNPATNETVYVGYFQSTSHVALNYLGRFANASHDNLFRPPIYS